MVDAAVLAGVRRFIPSYWGNNAENKAVMELQSGLAAKAEIVEYLSTKESTGLTWTSVVPGLLIDMYDQLSLILCLSFTYGRTIAT